MSIDLSEFHDVFFEECFEGLDVLEAGLLGLDQSTDIEEINAIFRAAHSIKGGAASFGFMGISDFTHVMETLLDEMRDGRRTISREDVDLLLGSVDVLRVMVNTAKRGEGSNEDDVERIVDMQRQLEATLVTNDTPGPVDTETQISESSACGENLTDRATVEEAVTVGSTESNTTGWRINFKPCGDILRNGNEPIRIFRELQKFGALSVCADTASLPGLSDINPKHCYLAWTIELDSDVSEDEISELFSWVADESELEIIRLGVEHAVAEEPAAEEDDAGLSLVDSKGKVNSPEQAAPAAGGQPGLNKGIKSAGKAGSGVSEPSKESGGNIRVSIDKVDELINMVGELVITQSMLSQIGSSLEVGEPGVLENLRDGIAQLERNTRELQESVLQVRMLPVSFAFSRFPRLVRDLSGKMGKSIELKLTGEQTELDKTVLEKIGDPLMHLVRNSLDHGLETPEVRKAAGKSECGTLELRAYHEGGDIIIKVIDDGAGLNRERICSKALEKGIISENDDLSDEAIYNLIFLPGFSTAAQLSDVSGRGVGMDVVRRNVCDLGGNVSISSNEGAGSTVTIRLPLTLAILDGQLVRIADETYVVSLVSIAESLQMEPVHISSVTGKSEFYHLRDEYIPIIRVSELFGHSSIRADLRGGLLMVVETEGKRFGLYVDELMGQQQVVIKSLEANFQQVQGISGATILGDGTVALIIDVAGLIQSHFDQCSRRGVMLHAVA